MRRIYDDVLPADKAAIAWVQEVLRQQFQLLPEHEIQQLPLILKNPLRKGYRTILFVGSRANKLMGFAILLHFSDLDFCYLDFISVAPKLAGKGIGGVLYERVREESHSLKSEALFFECLPDDPALCSNPDLLAKNRAVLTFYERYGALPIVGTAYETPLSPGSDCPPYLMLDPLGNAPRISGKKAAVVVRAILERKYRGRCPAGYIQMVADSFPQGPLRLREPRYGKARPRFPIPKLIPEDKRILLVINDQHHIHHVHDRGYVEAPVRVRTIIKEIQPTGLFRQITPRHFSEEHIKEVHESRFVDYLKRVCARIDPGESIYPYVFPIRNVARPPKELPVRAGYYCIDTFTPLNENAYRAARRAVDCALTGAEQIIEGDRLVYALVRPPGHHAERKAFGGFCYFNSAAIAGHMLSRFGTVAILDIDYHHGNGTQDIFYMRKDVLTVSIHGHPSFAYPYFSGFKDEVGEGQGVGFNRNVPLPEQIEGGDYTRALEDALHLIAKFKPHFLVVALGFDTAKDDPTGTWMLRAKDFENNGRKIGALGLPTLVVQEGGYRVRSLGRNARNFFIGLWSSLIGKPPVYMLKS